MKTFPPGRKKAKTRLVSPTSVGLSLFLSLSFSLFIPLPRHERKAILFEKHFSVGIEFNFAILRKANWIEIRFSVLSSVDPARDSIKETIKFSCAL
jgi:hypothetical protein